VGTSIGFAKETRQPLRHEICGYVLQTTSDSMSLIPRDIKLIGQETLPKPMPAQKRLRRFLSRRR